MDSLLLNIIALVSTHAESNHRCWKWTGHFFLTDYHHETANPKIWKTHRKPTQKDYAEQTLEDFLLNKKQKSSQHAFLSKVGLTYWDLYTLTVSRALVQSLEGSPPILSKLAVQPKKNTSTCSFADLWKDHHLMSMSPNKMKKFETIRQARFPIWTPPWRSSVFFSWKFWWAQSLVDMLALIKDLALCTLPSWSVSAPKRRGSG